MRSKDISLKTHPYIYLLFYRLYSPFWIYVDLSCSQYTPNRWHTLMLEHIFCHIITATELSYLKDSLVCHSLEQFYYFHMNGEVSGYE